MEAKVVWLTDVGVHIMRDKLAKLARVADKLGCELPTMLVDGYEYREIAGVDGEKLLVKMNRVTLTGAAPKLDGWVFVGTLQHEVSDNGSWNNVVRLVPGLTLGEERAAFEMYQHEEPRCGHCGKVRNRKDTYIVHNGAEPREWEQVGSTCLKDFLGSHRSPAAIGSYLEMMFDLEFDEREHWNDAGYMRPEIYMELEEYLAHVACMMRLYGWASKKSIMEGTSKLHQPTSSMASVNWENQRRGLKDKKGNFAFDAPTAPDYATARDAIAWARTELPSTARSGFEMNLVTACMNAQTNVRNAGIVAALIASWKRAVAKKLEASALDKKGAMAGEKSWVGEVGKRVEIEVEIMRIIEHESDYGVTNIHILTEVSTGNRLVWFASGGRTLGGAQQGWTGMITGSVKAHEISKRNGEKETIINRCKVV